MTKLHLFNLSQIGDAIKAITELLLSGPVVVEVKRARRTLSQNALYWRWMSDMSTHFTKRGYPLTKDDAHDLMRHKFLGHQTRTIGQTEVTKLRSTTDLDKSEMSAYMTQIDAWCVDRGCFLTKPVDSEYMESLREQGEAA